MMLVKYHFPYEEKKLSGIFGKGIRKKAVNLAYKVKLYPTLGGYPASNCFDGNSASFCHTYSKSLSTPQYLEVQFLDVKARIEGYAIQNRHEPNMWNPLNYVIQGSNDGVNYENITNKNEDSSVCGASLLRTYRIYPRKSYFIIRLLKTGNSCYGCYDAFNIAEFDIFGYFFNPYYTHQVVKITNLMRIFLMLIILLHVS